MSMRKLTIHACTLGVTLISSQLVSANTASWNGSYVAEGACFCTGTQGREIDSRIIPTPVGGQSISQICERVGTGPTLQKVNGKFNFPVYADAQCGHGPFSSNSGNADEACSGHLGVAGEDCVGPGPKWNIQSAFAKSQEVSPGISDSPSVTGGSRYILPPTASVDANTEESTTGFDQLANTSVKTIVETRSRSTPVVKAIPLTREEIRARQLVQIEAARERANILAGKPATAHLEIILSEEQKAVEGGDKIASQVVNTTPAITNSNEVVETTAQSIAKSAVTDSSDTTTTLPTTVSALKLPVSTRNSAREFDYVEGLPVSYAFGGAGVQVAASISSHRRMQYLLQASVADTYQEALVGLGFFLSPSSADRLTILLSTGIEYGKFQFQGEGVGANLSDAGAYLGLSSRFVVNAKFELQAGVGYSSFFEGDATVFGSAFYHLTPNLDITTKAEGGDNDSLGFGVRYYY